MDKKLQFQFAVGILVGLAISITIWWYSQPYTYQGSLIEPPVPAWNFSLSATDGTIFELEEQRSDIVLLFFGYTHCPDVCPTTLYDLSRVLERLEDHAERVQVVFVTVDPNRDSLAHLRDYVTTFNAEFIALGGSFDALHPVWDAFGVYREEKEVGSAGGYLVDHTARVYLIDPDGNLRLTFPFGMPAEAMAEDLLQLLKDY
jgi:protein SCO1/2